MNEEEMNRFARGELSPEESRALAQRALDDPDLFDELTAVSVGRAGLSPRRRTKFGWPYVAIATAAAAVVLAVAWPALRKPASPVPSMVAVANEPTVLAPTLLARNRDSDAPVFRGPDAESRPPRPAGTVVSVEAGLATIDVGSVDGLAKGASVQVLRDGKPVGTVKLNTIFRERARGNVTPGLTIRTGDQVRIPDAAFLSALLDEIDALSARGDSAGAIPIANQAAQLTADSDATNYADLNNLGVIAELRGDKAKAESLYRQAAGASPPDAARMSIEGNLARVKGAR
jgi:hypothetical protein